MQCLVIKPAHSFNIPFKRTKVSGAAACQANFIEVLAGKTPISAFNESKLNIWSEFFDADEFYRVLKKSGDTKVDDYLEGLIKVVHKDEVYVSNLMSLTNHLKSKSIITIARANQILSKKSHSFFKFTYDNTKKKFLSTFVIDEGKSNLIKKFISKHKLGDKYKQSYEQVLRKSSFTENQIQFAIDSGMKFRGDKKSLAIFEDYIQFLENYQGKVVKKLQLRQGFKDIEKIYTTAFDRKWYDLSRWYKPHRNFKIDRITLKGREKSIKSILDKAELSDEIKKEYMKTIFESKLTDEQVGALLSKAELHNATNKLEKFKEFIAYLDYLPGYKATKAIKSINKIYKYSDKKIFFIPDMAMKPHQQFIAQRNSTLRYKKKSYKKDLDALLIDHQKGILEDIAFLEGRKRAGKVIDEIELARLYNRLDEVPMHLRKRAQKSAAEKARLYGKLKTGCNGGKGSKKLQSATKKFKRFKLALAVGGTPFFYLTKNWDKKDKDPFFWEKLGQEMLVGIMFTTIANKIITNTGKGFWARYIEAYTKFAAVDLVNAGSYDALFGSNSYVRYFQQIYSGKELQASEVEEEFERMRNSPNFDKQYEELITYLDEMAKKKNLKGMLDDNFNLGAVNTLDDTDKITQEDLETEEGRDMMLELITEKMYLSNMGDWEAFQTGNKGMDRWAFYRARNSVWDIKGMALSIAMFQILCRASSKPLHQIGAWGLVLGLTVGDSMLSGDYTYEVRREAINQ